jgi:hypothetical protein
MSKRNFFLILFVTVLLSVACQAAPVQNDGDHSYRALKLDEVDKGYYDITGNLVGLPVLNEFTGIELMPYRFLGLDDQNSSPVHVMRMLLTEDATSDLNGHVAAAIGKEVGFKAYGSMMNSALIGDLVTWRCRLQNEAVGAVAPQERFDGDRATVLEFENCRPLSPVVNQEPEGR